jgi:hypothetical protein
MWRCRRGGWRRRWISTTGPSTKRTAELVARTETDLLALEQRVRDGKLTDPAKIGRAAQRILGASGVARLFDVDIAQGRFIYHYNEAAFDHETRLAGRYVLTTSLPAAHASARMSRLLLMLPRVAVPVVMRRLRFVQYR